MVQCGLWCERRLLQSCANSVGKMLRVCGRRNCGRIPRRRSLLTGRCGTDRHCYEKDSHCRRGNRSFDWPDLTCVSPDRNQGIVRLRNRRRGSMDQSDSWRQFDRIRTGLLAGPQHTPRVLRDVDLQLPYNDVFDLPGRYIYGRDSALAGGHHSCGDFHPARSDVVERTKTGSLPARLAPTSRWRKFFSVNLGF